MAKSLLRTSNEIVEIYKRHVKTVYRNISGTKIVAGYFITSKNSKGIRNIIYFANFELKGNSYYVELSSEKSESESLRTEISSIIYGLIQNGASDLSVIRA